MTTLESPGLGVQSKDGLVRKEGAGTQCVQVGAETDLLTHGSSTGISEQV